MLPLLPVVIVAYAIAAGRTDFDEDEAAKVSKRERAKRRRRRTGCAWTDMLVPSIRDLVKGARGGVAAP